MYGVSYREWFLQTDPKPPSPPLLLLSGLWLSLQCGFFRAGGERVLHVSANRHVVANITGDEVVVPVLCGMRTRTIFQDSRRSRGI